MLLKARENKVKRESINNRIPVRRIKLIMMFKMTLKEKKKNQKIREKNWRKRQQNYNSKPKNKRKSNNNNRKPNNKRKRAKKINNKLRN